MSERAEVVHVLYMYCTCIAHVDTDRLVGVYTDSIPGTGFLALVVM